MYITTIYYYYNLFLILLRGMTMTKSDIELFQLAKTYQNIENGMTENDLDYLLSKDEKQEVLTIVNFLNGKEENKREQEDKKKRGKTENQKLLIDAVNTFLDSPRNPKAKRILSKMLTEEYHLFMVQDENKKWNCYRDIENTYTQIDITDLTDLIRDDLGVELSAEPQEIQHMLNTITRRLKFDNNYYELKKHMLYLNPIEKDKIKIIPKEQCKNIKTSNQLVMEGNEQLINYIPNLTDNPNSISENNEVNQLLKQVTIPKNNPDNTKLYNFVFDLIALSFLPDNPAKKLVILYTQESGSGKSTITKILQTLFYNRVSRPHEKELTNDSFSYTLLENKNILIFDELDNKSIDKIGLNLLKEITSPTFLLTGRRFKSAEEVRITDAPFPIMCTNHLPDIDTTDIAFLNRLIIVRPPNLFVADPEPNTNQYKSKSNIKDIIESNADDLSEIATVGLNRLMNYDFTGDLGSQLNIIQTIEETMSIIARENPLRGYISLFTEIGNPNQYKKDWLTTKEIIKSYSTWYRKNYKNEPPAEDLDPRTIGRLLGDIHKLHDQDKGKRPDNGNTTYNVRILTESEINQRENKHIVLADIKDIDIKLNKLIGLNKTVYEVLRDRPDIDTPARIKNYLKDEDKQAIDDAIKELGTIGIIDPNY